MSESYNNVRKKRQIKRYRSRVNNTKKHDNAKEIL